MIRRINISFHPVIPRSINDMLYRLDATISMTISGEIESPGFGNSSKLISDILSS
jgi:hypothetical protein